MAIFRTLFVLSWILLTAASLSAQTTWYLRSDGDNSQDGLSAANAKRQISALTLADGDVIDIGPGTYDAATITASVHFAGANAGNATYVVNVGGPTPVINETTLGTITINAADKSVTFEGVRWSETAPIATGFNCTGGLVVTVTNSHFDQASSINATAAGGWKELYISECDFDGADGAVTSTNAVTVSGLEIANISENQFRQYTESAISLTAGSGSAFTVRYNEFTGNNTSATGQANRGAIVITGHAGLTSAEIHNNVFTTENNGVVVNDPITGALTVRYNKFGVNNGFHAIKNIGTSGPLTATCNNYGANALPSAVRSALSGSITALPYNFEGDDVNGGAIGFEPNTAQSCATGGPVMTSTTEGAGTSYFTISEAITASTSGAVVRVLADTYNENLTINKRLKVLCYSDPAGRTPVNVDTTSDGRSRTSFVNINGTITITSTADEVELNGLKVTRPGTLANVQLVTTNASLATKIRNCSFVTTSGGSNGLGSSVPTNGVVHVVRSGDISIWQSSIARPGSSEYIRALTFAAGNGSRNVRVERSAVQGTLQMSGLSALSNVLIDDNLITDAGVDGVAVTGNFARTLNVTNNTITNARENGVAWKNGASVGANSATVAYNLITGSGQSNASGTFAGIFVGSQTAGSTQTYSNNSIHSQNTGKNAINQRLTAPLNAACNWWGHISEDVIITGFSGAGTVNYDNGSQGWYGVGTNTATGNGFAASGACSARSFTFTLNKTNISCNGSNNGSITATPAFASGDGAASYSWSNSTTAQTATGLAAGTYSVTVTANSGNYRSQTATVYSPTAITAVAASTDITCFDKTDGIITITTPAAGGEHADATTRSYQYSVKNSVGGALIAGPTSNLSFTGLDAGTYDVFVTALASTNGSTITNPACETEVQSDLVIVRPALLTTSSTVTSVICNATTATMTVTFSGGVGPYNIAWTGTASGSATGVTSPYTITGLAVGTYEATVTDKNLCTSMTPNSIIYTPVTNTTTGLHYATIQGAIDAATAGHTLSVCAGDYTETVTVSKSLTINGPNSGKSGTDGARVAEAVIDGNFTVNANNTTISGVKVVNGATSDGKLCGVYISDGVTGTSVTNSVFERTGTHSSSSGVANKRNGNNTGLTISNNLFTDNGAGSGKGWETGVFVELGASATVSNNTFTGLNVGVNNQGPTGGTVAVSGNTFNSSEAEALSINNVGSNLTLTGNTFAGSNVTYMGSYHSSDAVDATDNTFNGVAAASLTLAQLFDVEDKTTHTLDGGSGGLFRVRADNIYVTTGSGSIQRGINAATAGDKVNVKAGTYDGVVNINKANLELIADGAATIRGTANTDAISVRFSANGVTLRGFTVDNANVGNANNRAIAPQGTSGGSIINNTIVNAMRGVQGDFYGFPTNLTISGNTFETTVDYGVAGTENMTGLTITNNFFKTTTEGVGLGTGAVLSSLSDNSFTGTGVAIKNYAATNYSVTCNWYGTDATATVASTKVEGTLTWAPFLISGTDDQPATAGFQPVSGSCVGGPVQVYVNSTATEAQSGHQTITSALNAGTTVSGNEIRVDAGTYNESLVIDKGVAVKSRAVSPAVATISGTSTDVNGSFAVRIAPGANNIVLEGFTISNENASNGRAVALGANTGTTTIKNNTFINSFRGVQGDFYGRPTNVTIEGNTFSSTVDYGIAGTEDVATLSITGNTFNTKDEGIGLGTGAGIASGAAVKTMRDAQTWSLDGGYAIKDYRDNTVYVKGGTIQNAISHGNTVAGDIIDVVPGTYTENVSDTKGVVLVGPNAATFYNGTRSSEAIINGSVSLSGDGGELKGFELRTTSANAASHLLNVTAQSVKVQNNLFKHVEGSLTTSALVMLNASAAGSTTFSGNSVTLSGGTRPNNALNAIGTSGVTGVYNIYGNRFAVSGTGTDAYAVGLRGGTVTLDENFIEGDIAGGVIVDGYGTTGGSATILSNDILIQSGVGVRVIGSTSGAADIVDVNQNTIHDITPLSGSSTGLYVTYDGSQTLVQYNSFDGNNTAIQFDGGGTLATTCNWFGTKKHHLIAPTILGNVSYDYYSITGVDGRLGAGFEADNSTTSGKPVCLGIAVVIHSATEATPQFCDQDGSITVRYNDANEIPTDFTGSMSDEELRPYTISWTGAETGSVSNVTAIGGVSTSPYTITGLSAGTYTVTVTDDNGSEATSGVVTVNYKSVRIASSGALYTSIQSAINAASAGDVIEVCYGTFTENLTVSKRLTIDGRGSGSDPATNTVITSAASGTSTIVYSAGGVDATTRQILKDVRVTGASGGTGNNNSGILLSGGSMGYFTFDNIVATGNSGHGLVSNVAPAASSLTDVIITGSTFSSNGSAGIRTASHSVSGFTVTNSSFTSNTGLGLAFNSSDNTTAQIGGVALTNVTFSGNNSVADLYAFRMLGTMSLTNVDFQGSNGAGLFGLYLLGGYVDQTSAPAIAAVTLNDVTFSGTYTSAGLSFLGYSNLANVSMTDVVLNTSVPTADRAHIRLSGVAGTLNLGNTAFTSPATNPPALDIRLGSNFNSPGSIATVQVDATSATFGGKLGSAMTLGELFALEDRIRHGTDNTTDATGFVRVKATNAFVTTNSGSVQRGITVASAGDILNINSGTYTAQAVTVNKRLDIVGQGAITIIQNSGGTVFTYAAAGSGTGAASANRAYLRNVMISGSTKGLYAQDLVNYLTLDGVTFDGNTSYAIHLNNTSGTMQDWAITNSTFNGNSDGFRMGMAANLDGLSITGTTFTSNSSGSAIYVPQQSSSPGGLNNVTITGNTFTGNGNANNQAALYIEKLSNATISNNTLTNNGTSTNPRGMIINLKYGTYSDITISGNTLSETRGGTQTNGYAINVQGRNDATSYNSNPGTASTVAISSNVMSGFLRGIEVDNAVDWATTTISNNAISGCTFGVLGVVYGTGNTANGAGKVLTVNNNSILGATNPIVSSNANGGTINAECNWYGTKKAHVIAASLSGTGIDYSPYLVDGTDDQPSTTGFQPVTGACTGTPVAVSLAGQTNVSCFGGSNGSIDITVAGGTGTYTYAWTGPDSYSSTSDDISSLKAGTYNVTATDGNESEGTLQVVITEPTLLVASIASTTNATCFGASDGTATASASGGTSGYSYSWNTTPSQSGITATGLGAGTYTVTVTDANNCTKTAQAVITEPVSLSATVASVHLSCDGANNGSITVSAPAGGYGTFETSVNGTDWFAVSTATSYQFTGLSAGTYTVRLRDAANTSCVANVGRGTAGTEVIYNPTLVSSTINKINISCNGSVDGSLTVTATTGGTHAQSGGARTFSYRAVRSTGGYDVPNATGSFTGLSAGTYTISAIAAEVNASVPACTTDVATAVIYEPSALTSAGYAVNFNGLVSSAPPQNQNRTQNLTGPLGPGAANQNGWNNVSAGGSVNWHTAGASVPFTVTNAAGATPFGMNIKFANNGGNAGAGTSSTDAFDILYATGIRSNDGRTTITTTGTIPFATYSVYVYATHASNSVNGRTDNESFTTSNGFVSGTNTRLFTGLSGPLTITDDWILNGFSIVGNGDLTSKSNITCAGANDGKIFFSVGGATHADAPTRTYQYRAVSAALSYDQTNSTGVFSGLLAGTYDLSVIVDASGSGQNPLCTTAVGSQVINEPTPITATVNSTNITCNSSTDGTITVSSAAGGINADLGSRTYKYMIARSGGATTGPQTSASFTGLNTGTYTVSVVADASGSTPACTTNVSGVNPVVITRPDVLNATVASANISCNAATDGTVTITDPTGGYGTYEFRLNTGSWQSSGSFTGLNAGTYSVQIRDAAQTACAVTLGSQVVTRPAVLAASISSQTDVLCNGATTGAATAAATGGTGAYSYSWNSTPAQTTATATGLAAGTYTVTVTDANNCTTTAQAVITQPTLLVATVTGSTNVSCNGGSDGTATASGSGGTPGTGYTYSWNTTPEQTTATATGLVAGTYTVTVTDANSCVKTADAVITQPTVVIATVPVSTNVSCNGGSDGTATAMGAGGTGSYSYSWNTAPAQTTAVATGLSAGTYTVEVKDANNCAKTAQVVITQPTVLTATMGTPSHVTCNGGSNGSVTVTAGGGNSGYTYLWSNSQTGATATGLVAGTYSVTVTDSKNCTASASVTINQPTVVTQHALVVKKYNGADLSCNTASDGQITGYATGGTGSIEYQINGGTWQSSGVFSGLSAGTYTITARDANGCLSWNDQSAILTAPPALTASTTLSNFSGFGVSCFGGSNGTATAVVGGGTGSYSYSWNTAPVQTAVTATGLAAGTYTVTVTDANGCEKTAQAVITQPGASVTASIASQVNVSCNGLSDATATAGVTGGATPYTYLWSNSQATATATGLAAGTYGVTVTDANGCQSSAVATITQPDVLSASIASQVNVLCFGGATGTATTGVTGGTTPYSYSWTNGQTAATATGLAAGTYGVTVTDDRGCTSSTTVTISQPASAVAITSSLIKDVCLSGESTGEITIGASGGTGTLSYTWTKAGTSGTFASTQNITGLTAGTYTVTVNDANGSTGGCAATGTYEVLQPAVALAATQSKTNITCFTATDGTVTVSNPVGGWDVYYANLIKQSTGTPVTTPKEFSSGTPAVFTGLDNGDYYLAITTQKNAVAGRSIISCGLNSDLITIYRPSQLVMTYAVTNTSCGGTDGKITVTGSSGGTHAELTNPVYEYVLTNDGETMSPVTQTSLEFTGLTGQVYKLSIRAKDVSPTCGRQYTGITLEGNTPLGANVAKTNIECNTNTNGTITVSGTTGGTSFLTTTRTYRYKLVNTVTTAEIGPQTSGTFTGLTAGTYGVDVIADAVGGTPECTQRVSTQVIYEPSAVVSTTSKINVSKNGLTDGQITFSPASGGVHTSGDVSSRSYEYYVTRSGGTTTGPQASTSFTGLAAGTYTTFVIALADGQTPACTTQVNSQTILAPTAVNASVAKINIECNGNTNGSITVSGTTGGTHADALTRSITYRAARNGGLYDQTNGTGSFTGLIAGTYTVSVIAAAEGGGVTPACTTDVGTVEIMNPTMVSSTPSKTNIVCNNANDGTITTTAASGGTHDDATTRSYQYYITRSGDTPTTPSTARTFTGLQAGTYTVSVIALVEGSGVTPACTTNVGTVEIMNPTVVTATSSKINISCNGGTDGSISASGAVGGIHADAGSRTYTYRAVKAGGGYDQTYSDGSFTGLGAGTYTVSVIAAMAGDGVTPACTTELATHVINEPTLATATVVKNNISCNGNTNGSITASSAAGGTHADAGSRTYLYRTVKSGGGYAETNSTGSFTGLGAGTYTVSVIAEASGSGLNPVCTTEVATRVIFEPTAVTSSGTIATSNPTCNSASDGSIDIVGGAGGTHADASTRDYRYSIAKVSGSTVGPQTSALFTGLTAGTYNLIVTTLEAGSGVTPECVTTIGQRVLVDPSAVTYTFSDNADTVAPYVRNGGTVTFTLTVQGGTPLTHVGTTPAHYNVTWDPSNPTEPTFVSSVAGTGGSYVITYEITGASPDVHTGSYSVSVTDNNSCSSPSGTLTRYVSVYSTVDLYVDNINGDHATGTGTTQRPLKSITKAIDIASANETINVMQNTTGLTQYNEDTYGPVITKPLTFKRLAFSYDGLQAVGSRYSGLSELTIEPSFEASKAFVVGTSDVTFSSFIPNALFVNNSGTVQEAINEVAEGGTLTFVGGSGGTYDLSGQLTIAKALTLQGVGTPSGSDCDFAPTALLRVGGVTKLMSFSGTGSKTVRNLDLQVGKSGTTDGRFFEVVSAGAIDVSNIRFYYDNDEDPATAPKRLYGIQNSNRSLGVRNDVAQLVDDVVDNGDGGTGRVTYGAQGPLPWTNLEIGWKAEDATILTTATAAQQLHSMVGNLQVRQTSGGNRPTWRSAASAESMGGTACIEFDGLQNPNGDFMNAAVTATIVSGGAKSLFVAFRAPNLDMAANSMQVIYKHGDDKTGMSIVMVGTSDATEMVRLSIYDRVSGTQRTVSRDFINVKGNGRYIAQIYFDGASTTNRVGMAVDDSLGQLTVRGTTDTEVKIAAAGFNVTTLQAPASLLAVSNIALGTKSGSIRFGEGTTATTTNPSVATDDINTLAGNSNWFGSGGAAGTSRAAIGEVLIYNTAAKTTRDAVYCYLRNKFLSGQTVDNNLEKSGPVDEAVAGGEMEVENGIFVYPNPAESDLSVSVIVRQAGRIKIEIVDALGRVVHNAVDEISQGESIYPITLDVSNYATGTYAVRVSGAVGADMTQPFIIRR